MKVQCPELAKKNQHGYANRGSFRGQRGRYRGRGGNRSNIRHMQVEEQQQDWRSQNRDDKNGENEKDNLCQNRVFHKGQIYQIIWFLQVKSKSGF